MNVQTKHMMIKTMLTRKINRFSEIEVSVRTLLKTDIVPKEHRNAITSLAAYLHVTHFKEADTSFGDIIVEYVEDYRAKRSRWFYVTNTKLTDAINQYFESIVDTYYEDAE